MGRELKSGGRSLSKLGLGKFEYNILHMHIPPSSNVKSSSSSTIGSKRRRTNQQGEDTATSNGHEGIIEIADSDDEVTKRRR